MSKRHSLTIRLVGAACAAGTMWASAAWAGPGPDVIYSDCTDISHYAPVGGIHGYSLSTATCNVGDQDLHWGFSWSGTPGMAMNAYRLYDGRLEQVGMSWVKHACCAGAGSGCGLNCNGNGGSVLGVGCRDVYGSGYNAIQSNLGPRSGINAYTGEFMFGSSTSGNSIFKLLQVRQSDMTDANYPGALYFVEGVYVSSDDAPAGNGTNNASYKRVTIDQSTWQMTPQGAMNSTIPAIYAWRDHGDGVNTADNSVHIQNLDVPDEGRFVVGARAHDNGDGTWRYDYAAFNINSDRSGGSFAVRVPLGATVTDIGFHDVNYHSGEPYDPTDWRAARIGNRIIWNGPQPYAVNPNSNALRWGTMYNFWFTADRPPTSDQISLGLFKPGTPTAVSAAAETPGGCTAELDGTAGVDVFDLLAYLDRWFARSSDAELTDDLPVNVDVFDLLAYLNSWFAETGVCS